MINKFSRVGKVYPSLLFFFEALKFLIMKIKHMIEKTNEVLS